ncbi:MAG: amino acid ABC transporter permease [Fretibacterium sp.]|nr:amino acid ABC transporter permease [Fretibacterium sp.]
MKFSWEYFFATFPLIAEKLPVTLSLTLISAGFSLALGTAMALVNYYRVPVLAQCLKAWSSFIRGTPAVTQMFFFYYGLATVSALVLNMSPLVAVAVVMSLNMSAFVAESVRAALISVDEGQKEAALSLGMSSFQMITRIVIPQAVRVALPPLFNDMINLFKMSSLAFLVGIRDVMGASRIESAASFRFFECYAIVMVIYWGCTIVLTFLQRRLEKRCNAIYE